MGQYRDDDHQEDAPHLMIIAIRVTASNLDFGLFDRFYGRDFKQNPNSKSFKSRDHNFRRESQVDQNQTTLIWVT